MSKSDLLLLVHRIPYPPDKGDKIRSWNLFKHLCEKWNVHLGYFIDDPDDLRHTSLLQKMARTSHFISINPKVARLLSLKGLMTQRPLSMSYYASSSMHHYVDKTRAQFYPSIEMAFSSSMAQHIWGGETNAARIIDFCDSDAEKWRVYAETRSGIARFVYSREAKLLANLETQYGNQAEASFAITEAEAKIFTDRPGLNKNVEYWENGVDTAYYDPKGDFENTKVKSADLVFVGAMDYEPNIKAVSWFVDAIFPKIRSEFPGATFTIVGSNPNKQVLALGSTDGVMVTGRVPDVRPYLAKAKIIVAPLLLARGIQNKVLEAMAMAKPVIATTAAATGITAKDDSEILIANDPIEFLGSIVQLMEKPQRRHEIGVAARAFTLQNYSWTAKLNRLDATLKKYAS